MYVIELDSNLIIAYNVRILKVFFKQKNKQTRNAGICDEQNGIFNTVQRFIFLVCHSWTLAVNTANRLCKNKEICQKK